MNINKDIRWCFLYLCITIILGVALRMAMVITPFFNYRFVLHAHSHVALLGWVYMVTTTLVNHFFLDENSRKKHRNLFIITKISILGMLFSFPFQGYGAVSTGFSSLFILCSYWWSYFLIKNTPKALKNTLSFQFILMGIVMLVLSSVSIWLLPVAIVQTGKFSLWYNTCIYTFMHFQYNGWVFSALIGLILKFIEEKEYSINLQGIIKPLYFAIIGSATLSITGIFNNQWLYFVGSLAAYHWLLIVYKLYYALKKGNIFNYFEKRRNIFLKLFFYFLLLKTTLVLLSGLPNIAQKVFFNKDIVISYLHFVFLGVFACGWLFLLQEKLHLRLHSWQISLYFTAFFSTETLITYKGIAVAFNLPLPVNYFEMLGLLSFLFVIFAISVLIIKPQKVST